MVESPLRTSSDHSAYCFLLFQQKDSSTEESESSGDEEKQEVTSNFKEESKVTRDLCQNTQKPSRNVTPSKK